MNKEVLENLKTIKNITMDEKITFWREVMQYAHDRGIEFHIITWNIFVWAADGKYGITEDINNRVTIDYLQKSVKSLFETYPLLAGIDVTAGENMKRTIGITEGFELLSVKPGKDYNGFNLKEERRRS